ncbi:MAG: hypothetical protein OS112_01090 [Methanoregula sp.]|nr:MAG: hypothetical protein OS112_01090 [Methanoregula sp.]
MDETPSDKKEKKYSLKTVFTVIGIILIIILLFFVVKLVAAFLLVNDQPLNPFTPKERFFFLYDGESRLVDNFFMRGDIISIHGLNTVSDKVYLMITGPGIGERTGANLNNPESEVINDNISSFDTVISVRNTEFGPNTWWYNWRTNSSNLPPGTYTLYALSQPKDKNHLEGVIYQAKTIELR